MSHKIQGLKTAHANVGPPAFLTYSRLYSHTVINVFELLSLKLQNMCIVIYLLTVLKKHYLACIALPIFFAGLMAD